jgi:hypothetical protein
MGYTKAQRRAAGKKGARTRKENARLKALAEKQEDPHSVETPDEQRTSEQDVFDAYGIDRDAHDSPWERPSELQAPKPRPGFTQRWIRIRVGNDDDVKNSMRKFREGWIPRGLDTVPEGYAPPTFLHSRLGNVIGVEDLILCEMPVTKAAQRNAFYNAKKDRMIEGIENDLRNVSQRGPRIAKSHKTHVTKRRLRVPTDPADE